MLASPEEPAIRISRLVAGFGSHVVIDGLSLMVNRGEIIGLVGASGSGKTVLLRTMLGLLPKMSGSVQVLGESLANATRNEARAIGARCGTMFQQGALFSSLTVRENVEFPMREYLRGSDLMFREVALAKLNMVGLGASDAEKLPAELSGGMTKRVALARALALDPELIFLDEPTSGLDPIAAGAFDALIRALHQTLSLTVFMITHDLNTLNSVCKRVAALYEGKIIADGSMSSMQASQHPWVQAYFCGERGHSIHPSLQDS
ncbi:MAG: transporter ATP-binding protein [Hyphomicrobiales bacterium]|nr:transporter ATP-binding protein [Hyphomicrobiales bacterium]